MKTKHLDFNEQAKGKILKGIEQLANAVVTTLGPNGRNVIIENEDGTIQSTKDGVTVAKSIKLKDRVEDIGAQMLKQAAIKTADKAGDGTTTSTLLASELVREGIKTISQGSNVVEVKRGIEKAKDIILDYLEEEAIEIDSEDQIKQVAAISANNDMSVGTIIAEAMAQVGRDGLISIEESNSSETSLEIVEGMQLDRGYKSPYFVNDNKTMSTIFDNPRILLSDDVITQINDLLPLLNKISADNEPLLIIAQDVEAEALGTLLLNKSRGTLRVCAVKAPDYGERRTLILEDIAALTGATVVSKEKGLTFKKFNMDWLGSARKVTVNNSTTTIIDGAGEKEAIEDRVEEIKAQIENTESSFAREQLQKRLSRLIGGAAIINVGGYTELEMREKKDRIEDSLFATKAAIQEGILPGGGIALLRARHDKKVKEKIDKATKENSNERIGANILLQTIDQPYLRILQNAGILDTMSQFQVLRSKNFWDGLDVRTNNVIDFKEAGIIDPMMVTRMALENAVSIACTILLTECVVSVEPQKEEENNVNDFSNFM